MKPLRSRNDIPLSRERLPRHYGHSFVVAWGGKVLANGQIKPYRYALNAGQSDHIEFWVWDEDWLHVLSRNYGLRYLGIDVIEGFYPMDSADPDGFMEPHISWFTSDPDALKDEGTSLMEMRGDNVIRWADSRGLI